MAAAGRTQVELSDSSVDTGSVSRRQNKQRARDLFVIQVSDSSKESGRRRGGGLGKRPMLDPDLRLGVQTDGVHLALSSRPRAAGGHPESSLGKAVSELLHVFPLLCQKVAATLLYPLMEDYTYSAALEKAAGFVLENRIHETAFVPSAEGDNDGNGLPQGEEDSCQPVSQAIECGCCCGDYPFEEMVQCADGHLFCSGCLQRRVEESVFGGIKACGSLPCMNTDGCTESFPFSEIRRALPQNSLLKYEQRQAEDALARAKLQGLVYCPFCSLPWEVQQDMRVLYCPNESCGKASCLLCKEPDHLPLRCNEVEKKTETSKRRFIEEIMSNAVIRVCTVCKAELIKSEGCNKILYRCGQAMCYVCRKPIQPNYDHFCQHAREPNRRCTLCLKCGLWEKEEDDKVVNEAREAALKEIAHNETRIFGGAPEVAPTKRFRGTPEAPTPTPALGPVQAVKKLYADLDRGLEEIFKSREDLSFL